MILGGGRWFGVYVEVEGRRERPGEGVFVAAVAWGVCYGGVDEEDAEGGIWDGVEFWGQAGFAVRERWVITLTERLMCFLR